MIHLIPLFIMSFVILVIIAVAIYLKRYIHEKILWVSTLALSLWVLYEMLPGVLNSALKGVIENAINNSFPF